MPRPTWCAVFPRISSRFGPPLTLQPDYRHALLFGCDLGCFRIARRSGGRLGWARWPKPASASGEAGWIPSLLCEVGGRGLRIGAATGSGRVTETANAMLRGAS